MFTSSSSLPIRVLQTELCHDFLTCYRIRSTGICQQHTVSYCNSRSERDFINGASKAYHQLQFSMVVLCKLRFACNPFSKAAFCILIVCYALLSLAMYKNLSRVGQYTACTQLDSKLIPCFPSWCLQRLTSPLISQRINPSPLFPHKGLSYRANLFKKGSLRRRRRRCQSLPLFESLICWAHLLYICHPLREVDPPMGQAVWGFPLRSRHRTPTTGL